MVLVHLLLIATCKLKKSIKIEQKILQGIPSILASKTDVKISRNQLKLVEQNVLLKAVTAYTSVLASQKD